jgi:WD40 repeat protein
LFQPYSQEGVIRVWNVTNGEVVQRLHGHRGPITSLSLGPYNESDGTVEFCSGSEDGTVRLWRTAPWEEAAGPDMASLVYRKKSLRRPSPRLSKISGLHELFTSRGQEDDAWRVLKYGDKAEADSGEDTDVLAVAWRPGGGQVALAGRLGRIVVYDAASGAKVWESIGHSEPVNCLEYNAAGDQLASGGDDCTVRLWAANNGEFLGRKLHFNHCCGAGRAATFYWSRSLNNCCGFGFGSGQLNS